MKSVIFILITLLCGTLAHGQSKLDSCKTNKTAPPLGPYWWAADVTVKVYFYRGKFTTEQTAALKAAMDLWSEMARANGTGVMFRFAGETEGKTHCTNCIIVFRQNVRRQYKNFLAYLMPIARTTKGSLSSAGIVFDDRTTKPEVLKAFMAHELGHSMGLGDCPKCKDRATIMKGFPSVNDAGRFLQPSPCDLEVVRSFYQSIRGSNLAMKGGGQ